jgi:hypothetical protein
MCLDVRYGHFFRIMRDLQDSEWEHPGTVIWQFPSFSRITYDPLDDFRKKSSLTKFHELMDYSDSDHFEVGQLVESFYFDYFATTSELDSVFPRYPESSRRSLKALFREA